jgi:hypothetical protein
MKEKSLSYYVIDHSERLKFQHIVNNMIELSTDLVDYLNLS